MIVRQEEIKKELYDLRRYCIHEYNEPQWFDVSIHCKWCRNHKNITDDDDYYQISKERSE